ncbi:hypothetical protein FA95DRAFT_1558444 [Auriscalpium vulgare]|uniref:Uncharacterized protein n=1 Tax=Auriscalpium vulgare TaxID=40419 RepID=A0ACB8RVR8_9AGAM|nr:hypothetical protein FA95DRAFT_1558444 [Auriscalpium vulgare]
MLQLPKKDQQTYALKKGDYNLAVALDSNVHRYRRPDHPGAAALVFCCAELEGEAATWFLEHVCGNKSD